MPPGEPPEGPDKPDPDDLPDGLDPEDLPPMPMTTRKRRPPAEGEVEVFGVDEQNDEPVELARWVDLATAALLDSGVRGEAELSLLFVDEAVMADLNQRFMGAEGPTDVLAFPLEDPIDAGRWPDSGSTGPDREPLEMSELPLLLGDVVRVPGRRRPAGARARRQLRRRDRAAGRARRAARARHGSRRSRGSRGDAGARA